MTTGVLEAWSDAVGEALNAFSGYRFTRLLANVAEGQTSWPVESTFGWPTAGRVVADGRVYRYTGKTDTSLLGVRWDDPSYALPVLGRLDTPGAAVVATYFPDAVVRVLVTGSWSGSLEVGRSLSGATWETVGTLTENGQLDVSLGDLPAIRIRAASLTAGAAHAVLLPIPQGDGSARSVQGVLGAPGQEINTAVLPAAVLGLTLTGTWEGTLALEQSADGVTWDTVATYNANQAAEAVVTQVRVRVRVTAWTSGNAHVELVASARAGAAKALTVATQVVDFTREYSAVEELTNQFFADTATGENLSALGRSLGVVRPPNLTDDAIFRKVIQALAYLPKGTMRGLEIALAAFFGAGNFRVWEDFPAGRRNTVFIKLLNGINLATDEGGRAFLARTAVLPLDSVTREVVLPEIGASPTSDGPVLAVAGVRLADEARNDVLSTMRPSALTAAIYPGGPVEPVWSYSGTTETSATTMDADNGLLIGTVPGETALYQRTGRVRPESEASLNLTVRLEEASGISSTSGMQWHAEINDGQRVLAVGVIQNGDAQFGFVHAGTGEFLADAVGAPVEVSLERWTHVSIRKIGQRVELWLDGHLRQYANASSFAVTTANGFGFGHGDSAASVLSAVRVVGFAARTLTDYWNISGTLGEATAAGGRQLNTNSGNIVPEDASKALRTVSTASPTNTGQWLVETALDTSNVLLKGPLRRGATVQSLGAGGSAPHRVLISGIADAFTYPQDVGKKLEIVGSVLGNDGAYTISQLMRVDNTGAVVPLQQPDSGYAATVDPPTGSTYICELATAPPEGFDTEVGLEWRLVPNWVVPDTAMAWTLADSGSISGRTVTLRANPPLTIPTGYTVVVEVFYSVVRSAQILLAADVGNDPAGTWFPAYLPPPPLGAFTGFLPELTKAGVIAEVINE